MSSALFKRGMFSILALALLLRVWGLDYALPDILMTDEWFEVKRALKLGAGVFDLERVGKGGYYYLLFVMFGIYFVALKLFGAVGGSSDFLLHIFRDPTGLWLVGRGTTAAIGVLNVYLMIRLGTAMRDRTVGLIAGGFLAVHLMHVRSSHSITVDVPMVCALTAGLWLVYAWRDREQLQAKHYALLGVLTAIATATKLPAAVFVVCVGMLHLLHVQRRGRWFLLDALLDRRLLAYVAGGLIYVGLEPGIVIKIGDIFRLLLSFFQPSQGVQAADLPYPVIPDRFGAIPVFYWRTLFPPVQSLLAVATGVGILAAWRRDGVLRHPGVVFAVIFAAFLLSSKNPHQIYERYTLPILPIVLLYAASSVRDLAGWMRNRWVPVAVMLILAAPMIVASVQLDIDFGRPDTRIETRKWIEDNIPSGTSIFIAGGLVRTSALTAQLRIDPDEVDRKVGGRLVDTGQAMTGQKSAFYDAYKQAMREYGTTYKLILTDDAAEVRAALDEGRGEYALLVQEARELFDHEINRSTFPDQWRLWSLVESGGFTLVKDFPRQPGWLGPNLKLYRRVDEEAQE